MSTATMNVALAGHTCFWRKNGCGRIVFADSPAGEFSLQSYLVENR